MDEKNIHSGHRQRMKERFSKYPDSLSDHELLEMLLYKAIPRKDTNALAHELLRACGGSLKRLCEAEEKVIGRVLGAGEETARFLRLVGKIAERIAAENPPAKKKFVFGPMRDELVAAYAEEKEEVFFLFPLDKDERILGRVEYRGKQSSLLLDGKELAKELIVFAPKSAVVTHNHPSGNETPTASDDAATAALIRLLSLHSVKLADHIIVSGNKTYSYHFNGRLETVAKGQGERT